MSQANAPVQVIVAAFQSEDGAKQALKELKQARNQGLINIEDAAVIRKDEKGKLLLYQVEGRGDGPEPQALETEMNPAQEKTHANDGNQDQE